MLPKQYEDNLVGVNTSGQLVPCADIVHDGEQHARVWTMAGLLVACTRRRRLPVEEGVIVETKSNAVTLHSGPIGFCKNSCYDNLSTEDAWPSSALFELHFKWE